MDFEQKTFQFIIKNKLITSRGLVLIGVSGGADSMALLLALASLRHGLGVNLHAAHFNHRFRPQSLRDERFVVKWCRQLNIPITVGQRTGGKIARLSEDEARQMRFKFLFKTANGLKAQSVALAHTRNDLAETVLMRLMRGSGLYGLRAILPRRCIEGVQVVRPLLGMDRGDVEAYLKRRKVPFCTDGTNRMTQYERNRVRHDLLPLLAEEYNPQIVQVLSDLASTAGEDYEFISLQARKQFEKCVFINNNRVTLELKNIKHQHPAILRLIFRQMAQEITNDPSVLNYQHIEALEDLAVPGSHGEVDLPLGLKAVRKQDQIEMRYA